MFFWGFYLRHNIYQESFIVATSFIRSQMMNCFAGIIIFESCLFMAAFILLRSIDFLFIFYDTLMPASISLQILLIVTFITNLFFRSFLWYFSATSFEVIFICILNIVISFILFISFICINSRNYFSIQERTDKARWSNVIFESGLNNIFIEADYFSIMNVLGLIYIGIDSIILLAILLLFTNSLFLIAFIIYFLAIFNTIVDDTI